MKKLLLIAWSKRGRGYGLDRLEPGRLLKFAVSSFKWRGSHGNS